VAPALVICAWYAGAAVLSHARYVRAIDVEQPLTRELFHLHLHDHLSRDLRRLTTPRLVEKTELPSFNLHLSNADLDVLDENVPPKDGKANYVSGLLQRGRRYWDVDVRYRGRKHMHWLGAQKSWKVRVRDKRLVDGLATFNFINTPDPMPFDELIVMDLAREQGLLTPVYHPFRLLLNNTPMGIHFFSAQPDEGLLRNSLRIPGSMYSGNGAPADEETGVSLLWRDAKHWKKVAARLGVKGAMKDRSELDLLLEMIAEATDVEFAAFAKDHLDLARFAAFDALDVVFGGNQHDFDQNHKLYFDPYKARFEPVVWNFRGWDHRRSVNRTENPLQLRLKGIPGYLLLRNRIVLRLLDGECAAEALRRRVEGVLEDLAPAQRADPYWDAYHVLPRMDRYHRQLVRPMDEARQTLVLEARYHRMAQRAAFLRSELIAVDLLVAVHSLPDAAGVAAVDLLVSGHGGVRVTGFTPIWPDGCRPARWSLSADTDLDGTPAGDRDLGQAAGGAEAWLGLELLSGAVLEPRPPNRRRGAVRLADQARRYRFFIDGGDCAAEGVRVRGIDLLTEEELVREGTLSDASSPPEDEVSPCRSPVAPLTAGAVSAHPWCFPEEPVGVVRLGPGTVEVPETRIYRAGQRVEIRPGTTLRMGPGASLVFQGPVIAEGTEAAGIRVEGTGWGGLALQGPGTAGSRLAFFRIINGGIPAWGLGVYPGTLDVHDTQDVMIRDLRISGSRGAEDALHAAYVDGLVLDGVRIDAPPSDGLDLEFCQGRVRGLTVLDAGDEAIDLMGGRITVEDAVLAGAGGAVISVGEESRLKLRTALLSGGKHGLLVKNAGRAGLRDVLIHNAGTAVELRHRSARYDGDCRVKEKRARAAGSGAVVTDTPWRGDGFSLGCAPGDDDLADLRDRVLRVSTWDDLDSRLQSLRDEAAP